MFKNLLNRLRGENPEEVRESVVRPVVPAAESVSVARIQAPTLAQITFNVAGVMAKNEQKQDIQKLLRQNGKIYSEKHGYEMYGGYKNREIIEDYMEVTEFEELHFGKNEISFVPEPTNEYDPHAIKVYIKFEEEPVHIGYVPKKQNVQLRNIMNTKEVVRIDADYVGGKVKSVEYDDEKGKEAVVTKSLNLGITINVFYK